MSNLLEPIVAGDIYKGLKSGTDFGLSYPEAMEQYFRGSFNRGEMQHEDVWTLYGQDKPLLIDPSGEPLNFFHEDIDVQHCLTVPDIFPNGFSISEENTPFRPYVSPYPYEDPRVFPTAFHYTVAGPEFMERLTKKKRDNFKVADRNRPELHYRDGLKFREPVLAMYRQRAIAGGYDYLVDMFVGVLRAIPEADVRYILVLDDRDIVVGGFAFVRAKRVDEPFDVWYALIASFHDKLLYPAHRWLAENYFEPGSKFHYGVEHYFDPAMRNRFAYKRYVATDAYNSPYVAIIPPPEVQPPFYDQRTKQWVLES